MLRSNYACSGATMNYSGAMLRSNYACSGATMNYSGATMHAQEQI